MICPHSGTAQGAFGSFVFGVIVESKGYKAQGLRLKATKKLSFNSFPCAVGPVTFVSSFSTFDEVVSLAQDNRYGLRAAIYGGEHEAARLAEKLAGRPYCHPVSEITFGRFGTAAVNQPRSESWEGAFVSKPVEGYGYSGWIWETVDGEFVLKQGAKLLSIETSVEE